MLPCCYADVRINELYPVPTGSEYEWVELYNNSVGPMSLVNFTLTDLAENNIKLPTEIPGSGFIVATTSAKLNNGGDTIMLKENGLITDLVSYSTSLTSNQSYARSVDGDGEWNVTENITKGTSNTNSCIISPTPTVTLSPTTTSTPTITTTPTTIPTPTKTPNPTIFTTPTPTPTTIIENVYIWEAMVNPETGGKEWIEIYNDNNYEITLTDWYVDDEENTGSVPKKFTLTIPAFGYGAYELTSGIFNNDGDQVRVLNEDKIVKDSFEYQESVKGKTWSRNNTTDEVYCLQTPTKGLENFTCDAPEEPHVQTPTTTPTPTPFSIEQLPTQSSVSNAEVYTISSIQEPASIEPMSAEPMVLGTTFEKDKEKEVPKNTFPLIPSLMNSLGVGVYAVYKIAHALQE